MRANSSVLNALVTSQKGNALVEFGLILPLFLLLFMGMVTFSLALYNKTVLTMAIYQGARAGAVASSGQDTKATTVGNQACSGKLISFGAVPTSPVTATKSGGDVIVTANFTYTGLGFLGLYPTSFPISATVTMKLESP